MLPFCHITLKARKPVSREKLPDVCRTWGDWIKVRRIGLKLTKRQVSLQLNVSDLTIYLWEKNRVEPSLAHIPKIIGFLGRDPFEKRVESLGENIREYRRIHGLTQKRLAEQLGVDETTLASWENGEHHPSKKLLEKISDTIPLLDLGKVKI
ncbi:MAG: helix-turn-helix transcriptional regulator [Candidatus Aminicenantales bacterium]